MQINLQKYDFILIYFGMNIKLVKAFHITSRYKAPCMLISLLIIFYSATTPAFANQSQEGDTISKTKRVTCLVFGGGLQYGLYRDKGVAPFSFKGISYVPTIGLAIGDRDHTRLAISATTGIGIYEDELPPLLNFNTYDIYNTISIKYLFPLTTIGGDVWIGVGITNLLDVAVNPSYENAAAGISEFVGPEINIRHYHKPIATRNKVITFREELSLMPIAAMMRPGYAYIDNYTSRQPVMAALFDDYEWSMKVFGGIGTEIGFDIKTEAGNKIGISYRWSYYSSGESGQWRFDHSAHLINVDFYFKLN